MSNGLKLLTDWLRANTLSLDESKIKLLLIRPPRKQNITILNVKLNKFILTPEKTVTYLGIEIDENLSWNKQVEILAQKLSRTNGILSKLNYCVFSNRSIWLFNLVLHVIKKNIKILVLQKNV